MSTEKHIRNGHNTITNTWQHLKGKKKYALYVGKLCSLFLSISPHLQDKVCYSKLEIAGEMTINVSLCLISKKAVVLDDLPVVFSC